MSSYNPAGDQLVSVTAVDGETYEMPLSEFDHHMLRTMQLAIVMAVRIGAGSLAMIVLLLCIKRRTTPTFILNQLSLLLMVLHSGLYLAYCLGPFSSLSNYVTGFYEDVTSSDLATSAATNVIQVLLVACIEASMLFQVRAIFASPELVRLGYAVQAISAVMALIVFGFYLNAAVQQVIALYRGTTIPSWVGLVPIVLFAVSILLQSILLNAKLLFAIRARRFLGLRSFDSFHILLIMTTQTMIVPGVLVLVNYCLPNGGPQGFTAISVMFVVLSLPLASMWAASANSPSQSTGYSAFPVAPGFLRRWGLLGRREEPGEARGGEEVSAEGEAEAQSPSSWWERKASDARSMESKDATSIVMHTVHQMKV